MATRNTFGRALARARVGVRLTRIGLGRAIGRSQKTISRWEEGKTAPTPAVTVQLVEAIASYDARWAAWLREQVGLPSAPAAPSVAERRRELAWMIYEAADAADVPAKRLRAALAHVVGRASASGLSLEDVKALLS